MTVSRRKQEHIDIAVNRNVHFKNKSTGFEQYDFIHCALPESNYDDVSTETTFLNKTLAYPLIISAMTGGFDGALEINRQLAEIAQAQRVALGVGSQRQAMENEDHLETYQIVRKSAPDAAIIGNIGAAEIRGKADLDIFKKLIDTIEADALAVHLNPLQEILQPEGSRDFTGVLKGIETLVEGLDVPVIVKEIGCGISRKVAWQLKSVGVTIIDIAGAGGTSWAAMESHRNDSPKLAHAFRDWGIPTAQSLQMAASISQIQVIASGGIDNGLSMAKALALGADYCGAALPLLQTLVKESAAKLSEKLAQWREELKLTLFLTGCASLKELRKDNVIHKIR